MVLKYYPVAFATIYLCRHENLSKTLFHLSIQIIFFIFWILFCWEDLLIQKFTIPEPVYAYCIGLFPIVNFFSNISNINYIFSFSLIVLLSLIFILLILKINKFYYPSNSISNYFEFLFFGGSSIFLFCYIVKSSFDYRMIFLLFIFPYILNLKHNHTNKLSNFLLAPLFIILLITLSAWFECFREISTYIIISMNIEQYLPISLFSVDYWR